MPRRSLVCRAFTCCHGDERLESGICRMGTLHDSLHPLHSVAGLLVERLLGFPGRKALETADVRVNYAVNVSTAFVDSLPGRVNRHGTMIPSMPFRLPWSGDRGRRHSVVVSTGHGGTRPWWVGGRRWLYCLHIGVKTHSRMQGRCTGLLSLSLDRLVDLVRPYPGAVPRRVIDLEACDSSVQTHVPLGCDIPSITGASINSPMEAWGVGMVGIDHHG